ncbi:MAG TPA: glycoside hydrolase family 140 protein [Bacteroidales bacterium]|jgi:hypothetical protein|nr:glycoside hydrolase family 140 protein [Bacteroidales bacterium]
MKKILLLTGLLVSLLSYSSTSDFPLKISSNGRFFTDQSGKPFFINADTPWSLFVALDSNETACYLKNRKEKGFNTITVNLLEHWFNGETLAYPEASRNKAGNYPFTRYIEGNIPDFTFPDEEYFRHVDRVLEMALAHGFLVMMTPAYMGYDGEGLQDGWYREVLANGPERCRKYGQFLGKRYARFPNIAWIMDGDRNPDQFSRPLETEIVRGIREFDKIHLFTAHCHPANSSRDHWEGADWLDFNCVYTYAFISDNSTVHAECLRNYLMDPPMPVILFETTYENEQNANSLQIRSQMYWGWLCSVAGVQLGNLPLWRLGEGWQYAMDWQASYDASNMKKLVDSRRWWKLVPDLDHSTVTEGYGSKNSYVAAALADNGETAVIYIPSGAGILVDLKRISGKRVIAWWFNPGNGLSKKAGEFTDKRETRFTPPDKRDWVLVLDDGDAGFGPPGKSQ